MSTRSRTMTGAVVLATLTVLAAAPRDRTLTGHTRVLPGHALLQDAQTAAQTPRPRPTGPEEAPPQTAPPPPAPAEQKRPQSERPRPAAATDEATGPRSAASRNELAGMVVMIRATLDGAPTIGAGVIVSHGGDLLHIVTANHVVRKRELGADPVDAQDIEVQFHWLRGEWHPARLLDFVNDELDVAVLRVRGAQGLSVPPLPWASLVRPDVVGQGEGAVPIGYPGGEPWFVPQRPHYVSTVGPRTIRTEGDLLAGSSGGALTTDDWGIAGLLRSTGSMFNESSRIDLVVQQLENWGIPVEVSFMARRKGSGASTSVDPAGAIARDRQEAESLVARGIGAFMTENATAFVDLVEVPFYFDDEIVVDREDLRLRIQTLFDNRIDHETFSIRSIRASTVGELRAEGPDAARDRVMNSLSMSDADWRVVIVLAMTRAKNTESAVFFVRKVDGVMRLVGMWD